MILVMLFAFAVLALVQNSIEDKNVQNHIKKMSSARQNRKNL